MAFFDGGSRAPAMTWKSRDLLSRPRGGKIVAIEGLDEPVHARVFGTMDIKTWGKPSAENPNPRPVEMIVITVQTDEKNPENPLDDGMRAIYIEKESLKFSKNYAIVAKRGQPKTGTPYAALLDALEKAGTPKDVKIGGTYRVAWIGEEDSPADIPRKLFAAQYTPPVPSVLNGDVPAAAANPFEPKSAAASQETQPTPAAAANPFAAAQSTAPATSNPFVPPTTPAATDPLAVAREMVKLTITDAMDKAALAAIYDRAVGQHGAEFWTPELQSMAEARITQLANPPVREPVAAVNPFA